MTEYAAVAIRAKTEDTGCSRIETTVLDVAGPAIPTDDLPVEEALQEDALVREVEQRGHAVPVGRTLDILDADLLARVHALSERGVAHLFAEGGGIVLATVGSTAGDRRRAVESVPKVPDRRLPSWRVFGVLLDAGEPGSHYSEEEGWGLTGKSGKASPARSSKPPPSAFAPPVMGRSSWPIRRPSAGGSRRTASACAPSSSPVGAAARNLR